MEEKLDELQKLAQPLSEYLGRNYDPHCEVVISMESVKLIRNEMQVIFIPAPQNKEFIPEDSRGKLFNAIGIECSNQK